MRPRSDRANSTDDVYGDYTYLDPASQGWAFEFTGYPAGGACTPSCTANYLGSGDYVTTTVYDRSTLAAGTPIAGPAVVEEAGSTLVVAPGASATVAANGNIVVTLG